MHQSRQFTKRRPQSPHVNQQESLEGLKVGINKANNSRSGLVIQSNVPILKKQAEAVQEKSSVSHPNAGLHAHPVVHNEHHHHSATCQGEHSHTEHTANTFQHQTNYSPRQQHIHVKQPTYLEHHHSHSEGTPSQCNGHSHDHSMLDHSHDHSSHNHSGHHDHSSHDHSMHDHSSHDHSMHDHSSHDHSHDHSMHNHSHDHKSIFPQVYTQPLPSYADIVASLSPNQKSLFSCFIGQCLIGILVWLLGASRGSLAITGYSYLMLFDSFGILGNFISTVLHQNPSFSAVTMKRPFGTTRFEIIFSLANTIFLLFGTMYTTKESLEHLLLEHHHIGDHHENNSLFILLCMMCIAIGSSIASGLVLGNHDTLVKLRKGIPQSASYSYDAMSMNMSKVIILLKGNYFCSYIVSCGCVLVLSHVLGIHTPLMDKVLAFVESGIMVYLGGPTAIALAKVLLQTKPDFIQSSVDHTIRQIQQNPHVVSVNNVHLWQISYSKCVGTAEVYVKPGSDDDAVLESAYSLLENSLQSNGELTISVMKG